jgi:hypothetical protein
MCNTRVCVCMCSCVCVCVCVHIHKLTSITHCLYTHIYTDTHTYTLNYITLHYITYRACPKHVCDCRKMVATLLKLRESSIQVKHINTQLLLDTTCKLRDNCTVTGNKTKENMNCYACPVTANSKHNASTHAFSI